MEVSRMNNYTREDILRMVEEEDVGFIRLQFTDIFGTMKNIAIILVCALAYCFGVIYLLTQYLQGLSQIYLILKFKYLISKATHPSIAYFCRMVSY